MEWQQIETAPRDGSQVLLYGLWAGEVSGPIIDPRVDIGFWNGGESDYAGTDWWQIVTGDAYACWLKPTHWMPLPEPPKE